MDTQQPPTQAQIEASKMMVPIVKFWVEVMGYDHKEQPRALEIVSYLDDKNIHVDTIVINRSGVIEYYYIITHADGVYSDEQYYDTRKQATMHGILKAISIYDGNEIQIYTIK